MELTPLTWLLALLPVLVLLLLMVGMGWGGSRAGLAGFFTALLLALTVFGGDALLAAVAIGKSVFLAADVLYIVWMALFFYNVTNEAGTVAMLGHSLPRLTPDRAAQSLLISWVFVSLLQGVGGFGVPVAVVAPLLVGLGYSATQAVIMASLGHGWAVTFGSLGTSFVALTAVTGLPGEALAHDSALVLGLACLISGALVAYVSAGWAGLLRSLPMLLLVGAGMGLTQWFVATRGLWTLGSTSGALAGAVVGVAYVLSPLGRAKAKAAPAEHAPSRSLVLALAAYIILLALAFSVNLIAPLGDLLDTVMLQLHFPAVATTHGWEVPAESGRGISLFGHAGAILFYAGLVAFLLYKRANYFERDDAWQVIWRKVSKSALKSTVSILALVAMAALMTHTGMTQIIARGISETVSAQVYPLFAPFIGALGAFMTGSNTNSNVVFGALQQETALLLGLTVPIVLAGQTAGASLGSVLAPAKIIVGCSTVGLGGEEGPVIRRMLLLGLIPVVFVALITLLRANG
ncbi:MAG: L-lactate permease [Chloroflexi bacterium]|nr:L-lactate permease [Chloroflexota bacterium]MYA93355.1 L-lactate permease [Chloroflexota bacterium]MYH65089.1 L-lactate permease [Chloroflexota bacterium]